MIVPQPVEKNKACQLLGVTLGSTMAAAKPSRARQTDGGAP